MVSKEAFQLIKNKGLCLRVYCAVLLKANPGDEVRLSYLDIAKLIGSSKSSVVKAMVYLSELGLIKDTGKSGEKSTKVWLVSDEKGCQNNTSYVRGCQNNTRRGVEIGTDISPTIDNNSISISWNPPKWCPSDLKEKVWSWLGRVPEFTGDKRSQSQDRRVWQLLKSIESLSDEAKSEKIRDDKFWGEVVRAANWPKPPKGIGRAGYGKRIVIEIEKRLESVQGEDKLRSRAEAHLEKLRGSFNK